jgi:alpha-L-glutamate ligase-like protein
MWWLFTAGKRLRERGILGMNERNAACILDHNPRARFPLVDDKARMARLCDEIGVPTPRIHALVEYHADLRKLAATLGDLREFVVKPNRGSAGRGVLVLLDRDGGRYVRHNGERLSVDDLRQHFSDILSGMYSLGSQADQVLVQQRVHLHPAFDAVAYKGIPDVRVILYRNEPAMAMLRLPTKESGGRANLHQGGIGTGIDLTTGRTNHAVQRNRQIAKHPDTGVALVGVEVPYWDDILTLSRRISEAVGLGYLGVDVVVDAEQGPMLLEANARPGLAIQIANNAGLRPRLEAIDALLDRPTANPMGNLRQPQRTSELIANRT